MDVLHVGDIEQLLDTAEAPHRVLHRADDGAFTVLGELRLALRDPSPRFDVELGLHPGQNELALIGRIEPIPVGCLGQPLHDRGMDTSGQVMIHRCAT
ncbi:hypothetical protein PSA01_60210 [Pseudonocardia saturnea]|uniref:Uncharacterized protein n=1 Tax=Pseudonocardia saturnea TaxID=33909 RepID=A0ABQ0S7V4_9PSEU|nr:hypothetical protein Pdca_16680 [Pseudonocardia autotrophica]GEC28992.1 hypothetical protein PSA01_60210 [Pseudonocardia saturnea]